MPNKRDEIIIAASVLFETQGYAATGLSEILKHSSAPKGSLYYYFPDGKEQLAEEVVAYNARLLSERFTRELAPIDDPAEAVRQLVFTLAAEVQKSGYQSGGPLALVAMESATTSARLNQACQAAYDQLVIAFKHKLFESGYSPHAADEMGEFIVAAIEGATLLSRTQHSAEPLRRAGEYLFELLKED